MRALIADDVKATALIVRRALERCGLTVTVAHDFKRVRHDFER
jgi:CheY-like chemotaxis protein